MERGHLELRQTMQYYCPVCAKFLPDRYVEGRCTKCGNENSRSDQCDKCGATFEVGEIADPVCITCKARPEMRETQHYFFKLSDFEGPLLSYVRKNEHWRSNVQLFTQNWLVSGLKDRPITRDMSWGVPVPLPGTKGKVIYVWFEAVIGYLSASKEWAKATGDPEAWKEFWMDPEVKGYYFLGKDNIPFHTIIWPSILMGYGGLNLPYDVPANEFLTFKGEKLSKSKGPNIDIPSILKLFEADLVRYYLATNMPEGKDADFSWEDFETKVNNELVAPSATTSPGAQLHPQELWGGALATGGAGGGKEAGQRGHSPGHRGGGHLHPHMPVQERTEDDHGTGPVRQSLL